MYVRHAIVHPTDSSFVNVLHLGVLRLTKQDQFSRLGVAKKGTYDRRQKVYPGND